MKPAALVVAAALAGPLAAETYVDNPGLCDAEDGEQELADLAYLTSNGIESHALSCTWSSVLSYAPGLKTQVDANCYGQDGQFALKVDVSVNDQGRVAVFGYNASTHLPDFYFPCSRWGFKG